MTVIVLEKVPASVRGELTRWMLELRTGVFVGSVSATVRDALWGMVSVKLKGGGGLLIHNAANEQGFAIRYCGLTSKSIKSFEGLSLVLTKE